MKNRKDILWGLLLIVVGIIWGINSLGIVKIDIFFDGWWTLFIIVPSLIDLFTDEDKTGSIIGIIIGVFLLLACQDIIDFSMILKLLFPIVLVIIGLSLLIKNPFKGNKMKKGKENLDEYAATFGVQNLDFDNEKFNGCNLNAPIKLPFNTAIIALVIPQEGQGVPIRPLIKQIVPVTLEN